jgi:hypothetical protein
LLLAPIRNSAARTGGRNEPKVASLSAASVREASRTVTEVEVMISKSDAELPLSAPAPGDRSVLALASTASAVALDESKSGSMRSTIANFSEAGAASVDTQLTVAVLMGSCEASVETNSRIGVRSSLTTLEQLLRLDAAMAVSVAHDPAQQNRTAASSQLHVAKTPVPTEAEPAARIRGMKGMKLNTGLLPILL